MAVNWFEGGRRISKLFMALVGAVGAAYALFTVPPMPTLATMGPDDQWAVTDESCESPSYPHYLWDYDWGGERKGLTLCFLAASSSKIPYAVAPEPPEEARRRAQELARDEAADRARASRGEPPTIRLTPRRHWYYTGGASHPVVQQHINERVAAFRLTPDLRRELGDNQSAARWQALFDALPWVLCGCAFIWIFSVVIGWIIRGFAGVPQGQDFVPPGKA